MARNKTVAQLAEDAALVAGMEREASEDAESEPVKLADISAMIGEGIGFKLGELNLDIAPFTFSKISRAGELIGTCPEVILAHAAAAKDDQNFDLDKTAAALNRYRARRAVRLGAEAPVVLTAVDISADLGKVGASLSAEQTQSMIDLVLLAVQRNYPEATSENVDAAMNVPIFLLALSLILRQNPYFADLF